MKSLISIFLLLLHIVFCEEFNSTLPKKNHVKRSYVCPPKFIRQGHRCYYFSKEPATFQKAMFLCEDMHSKLAIIKTPNQDKIVRNFLSRKTLAPIERWLGGLYDWKKMAWKWAASGKPLTYKGFVNGTKEESWYCIVMDPAVDYRWNSRSCLESKHFICHTKMKTVNGKGKKKLQRQYNANKNNKLNEIPVPDIPRYDGGQILNRPLKLNVPQRLNDQALYATVPEAVEKSAKKNRGKKRFVKYENGTLATNVPLRKKRRKDKKNKLLEKEDVNFGLIKNIKWRTYRRKNKENPFYPPPIVEEYNFIKD